MKVLAALSGGVDSSVMAALLAEAGHDVTGVTMSLLGGSVAEAAPEGATAALREAEAAAELCASLGLPHRTVDLTDAFCGQVVGPFCRGYLGGQTPNPCLDCNRHLKLGALQRLRREGGYDAVATGHYARVSFDERRRRWALRRAADASKDQSYVLFRATQDDLAHLLLPLGELTKAQVREAARARGLSCAAKAESQDICFVPDGDYAAFIERYAQRHRAEDGRWASEALNEGGLNGKPSSADGASVADGVSVADSTGRPFGLRALDPGPIVDRSGQRLGTHQGIARYTLGQRKGLGVAAAEPLYVCGKDAASNTLTVGPLSEALVTRAIAHDVSMGGTATLEGPTRVLAKTHYRHAPQPATATQPDADTLVVDFDEPQRPVAPGQALVLYDGDVVLGGGTIA